MRTRQVLGLVVGAGLLLAACGGGGGSSPAGSGSAPAQSGGSTAATSTKLEKASLKVGDSVPDIGFLPLYVADAEGYFKEQGLDVKLVGFNGGTTQEQALAAGSIDLGAGANTEAMDLQNAHQDVRMFWGLANAPLYDFYAPKDMTLDKLKATHGKVAISKPGSLSQVVAQYALQKAGLNADKDVTYIAVGGPAQRAAALEAGQVQLIPATPPGTYILQKDGFIPLLRLRNLVKDFQYEVYYANEDFLKKDHNTVVAFLKANAKAVDLIRSNPDEAAKVLVKTVGFKPNEEPFAVQAVKEAAPYFPKNGHFAEEGNQLMVDFYKSKKLLPPDAKLETFQDFTYIKELASWGN